MYTFPSFPPLSFRAESRNLFRHSTSCPAPAAIQPSSHGLSVESVLRRSGSLLLLQQCRLESAETERHRGLDEPTSPFTSRAARNVGGQCSSCRFASPPPARGPRTIPFPHTSPHRSSNAFPTPLRPLFFIKLLVMLRIQDDYQHFWPYLSVMLHLLEHCQHHLPSCPTPIGHLSPSSVLRSFAIEGLLVS